MCDCLRALSQRAAMSYHQRAYRSPQTYKIPREYPLQIDHHYSIQAVASRRMTSLAVLVRAAAVVVGSTPCAFAQQTVPAAREIPARTLPTPTTVSPQMQRIIQAPIS